MRAVSAALALALGLLLSPGVALGKTPPVAIVACAPGYPGSTAEAQPAMDAFAAALAGAAGLPADGLAASYYETEAAGLARLAQPDAALVLVPLPFYLAHRKDLGLTARLQVIQEGGEAVETWSLVAVKGKLAHAADLEGWELLSLAAYSPGFVRNVALGGWGPLPAGTRLAPATAVLSALKRAAAGEKIALLLDSAQAKALPTLPFAKDLEVVTTSPPLPGSLLCSVAKRLAEDRLRPVVSALLDLEKTAPGAAALAGLRMTRFVPLDVAGLARAQALFDGGPALRP